MIDESLSGYKTGVACLVKCNPSVLHAIPILDVPAYFPMLSSALNKRKTVSFLTTDAGLNTSFSSHCITAFLTGQRKVEFVSGSNTGFALSAFVKGNKAQL